MKKGTQLLEIYALEIQMYTAQKNNKKLKVFPWNLVIYCCFVTDHPYMITRDAFICCNSVLVKKVTYSLALIHKVLWH